MRNLVEQSLCWHAYPGLSNAKRERFAEMDLDRAERVPFFTETVDHFASPLRMSVDKTPSKKAGAVTSGGPNDARFLDDDVEAKTVDSVFEDGPLYRLQSILSLVGQNRPNIARRALLVIVICWLPLLLLNLIHGEDAARSFLMDFGAHGRYLIAAPMLIIAEGTCLPRMTALVCNFFNAGLVVEKDYAPFQSAIVSTRKLLNTIWVEVAVIAAAYAFAAAVIHRLAELPLPVWVFFSGATTPTISLAGWWALLISLPVIAALLLAWMWRLVVWTRFLWLISRLHLRLIPAHPDGAAGIRFIGYSARAFTVLAFALGAFAAGAVANGIRAGASFTSYHYFIGAFVLGVVLILNAPLCVFFAHLLRAWRRGTTQYGTLADKFGVAFERKWFNPLQKVDETVLEQQDFSAATDLYQVVDRVYAMWLLPIHPKSVVMLIGATLLPFIPVALMAVPFDVVVNKLSRLLF